MRTPIVVEQFADNGAHSHWEMIDPDTGEKLAIEKMEPDEPLTSPAPDPRDELIEKMGEALAKHKQALNLFCSQFACKDCPMLPHPTPANEPCPFSKLETDTNIALATWQKYKEEGK